MEILLLAGLFLDYKYRIVFKYMSRNEVILLAKASPDSGLVMRTHYS